MVVLSGQTVYSNCIGWAIDSVFETLREIPESPQLRMGSE